MDKGMPPTLEGLLDATGLKPSACSCRVCRKKCAMMCLGTPGDVVRLINAGYAPLLRVVGMKVVLVHQRKVLDIGMVQLTADGGGCALYKDGRCLIHGTGLKPTEGRYFIHPESPAEESLMNVLSLAVALEWIDGRNREKVEYCFSKVGHEQTDP